MHIATKFLKQPQTGLALLVLLSISIFRFQIEWYKEILNQNTKLSACYARLDDALDKNDLSSAVSICDKIVSIRPDQVEGYYTKGLIQALAGDTQKSKSCFSNAASTWSLEPQDFDTKALAFLELGELDKAMNLTDLALTLGYKPAHGTKAKIYLRKGEYDRAILEAKKAVRDNHLIIGEAYLRLGKIDLAITELDLEIHLRLRNRGYCLGLSRFDLANALLFRAQARKQINQFDLATLDELEGNSLKRIDPIVRFSL